MKRKGFTLIELVVVIALIAILAVTLAPRLRLQIAKAKDAKAIAALGGLRTASEVYFAEETTPISPNNGAVAGDNTAITTLVSDHMDASTQSFFEGNSYVEVGGSYTTSPSGVFSYGKQIAYTFVSPSSSTSSDGIAIWLTNTVGNSSMTDAAGELDTKENYWASY